MTLNLFSLRVTEQQDIIYTLTWGAERMVMALTLLSSVSTWDFLLARYGKIIHLAFWEVIFRKAWFCFSESLKFTDAFISTWECTLITTFPHNWGLLKNNSERGRISRNFCICPYIWSNYFLPECVWMCF